MKPEKIHLLIGIYWKYLIELKKWNLKWNFLNPGKIFRQWFQILNWGESNFAGASPGGFKKLGSPIPRVDDLKDVECFKCHKKGH